MPITPVDFSQSSATYFAGDGAALNTTIVAPSTPAPTTFGTTAQSLLQGLYNLGRGAALSVKGVTGNAAAAVADIAAGTDGHVLRRAGTALAFGQLAIGAFADGVITLAKLANGTATSVVGRSANSGGVYADIAASADDRVLARSSGALTFTQVTEAMLSNGVARSLLGRASNSGGVRADVAGGGANTVYKDNGTSIVCSSLTLADVAPSTVLYEVDFSTLATNTLSNGTESIDSLNWTVANAASLGTFEITNGTGLRMIAGTSLGAATAFTTASQLAPYLYLPLSSISNFDARHGRLIIEIYLSSYTAEASGEGVFLGIWGPAALPHSTSAARVRLGGLYNGGTNRNARTTLDSTVTTPDANLNTHNVLCVAIDDFGTGSVSTGVWSSGWPTALSQQMSFSSATGAQSPMLGTDSRLVIGCGVANDASPTTAFTVQRMRIRRG